MTKQVKPYKGERKGEKKNKYHQTICNHLQDMRKEKKISKNMKYDELNKNDMKEIKYNKVGKRSVDIMKTDININNILKDENYIYRLYYKYELKENDRNIIIDYIKKNKINNVFENCKESNKIDIKKLNQKETENINYENAKTYTQYMEKNNQQEINSNLYMDIFNIVNAESSNPHLCDISIHTGADINEVKHGSNTPNKKKINRETDNKTSCDKRKNKINNISVNQNVETIEIKNEDTDCKENEEKMNEDTDCKENEEKMNEEIRIGEKIDEGGRDREKMNEEKIGKYIKKRKIGEGGYGKVYIVEDENGKEYAMKELEIMNKGQIDRSMLKETTLLQIIDHPNIIKVKEIRKKGEKLQIIMPNGDLTLKKLIEIKKERKENVGKINMEWKKLIYQLMKAGEYLEKNKIIHRDLKPSNIVLENGIPKLIDFGLGAIKYSDDEMLHNGVQTLYYRCPEILFDSNFYDSRIDVWSMGVILCEILCHRNIFLTNNETNLKRQIVSILQPSTDQLDSLICDDKNYKHFCKLLRNKKLNTLNIRNFKNVKSNNLYTHSSFSDYLSSFTSDKSLVSLINSMLQFDPGCRFNWSNCISHEWFNDITNTTFSNISDHFNSSSVCNYSTCNYSLFTPHFTPNSLCPFDTIKSNVPVLYRLIIIEQLTNLTLKLKLNFSTYILTIHIFDYFMSLKSFPDLDTLKSSLKLYLAASLLLSCYLSDHLSLKQKDIIELMNNSIDIPSLDQCFFEIYSSLNFQLYFPLPLFLSSSHKKSYLSHLLSTSYYFSNCTSFISKPSHCDIMSSKIFNSSIFSF